MYTVTIFKGQDVVVGTYDSLQAALKAAIEAKHEFPLSEVKLRSAAG